MPSSLKIVRPVLSLTVLIHLCLAGPLASADKISATVFVKDSLTAPRQEARIEAELLNTGLVRTTPLGGEPVELVVNGTIAATGMTGGDGRAVLPFVPAARSIVPVQVRVGNSPRVGPAEGRANMVVWERRTPVLVIEVSSLIEEPDVAGLTAALRQDVKPMPDAADELAKLSQFYYGIMYVAALPTGADAFATSAETRTWLSAHKFPAGLVLTIPSDPDALGAKIDELHEAGWKSIKTGIGRSKPFLEAFLRRRFDAILVPEPTKGDSPRKAKVAKAWKEVRKKL
jgi:hypothetical protein